MCVFRYCFEDNIANTKINVSLAVTQGMSEGLAVGTKAGLDGGIVFRTVANKKLTCFGCHTETIIEVLSMGASGAPMFKLKGPKVLKDDYAVNFPLKHAQKGAFLPPPLFCLCLCLCLSPLLVVHHQHDSIWCVDIRLGIALGDEMKQEMPAAAATNETFKKAIKEGNGDLDFSAIYKTLN